MPAASTDVVELRTRDADRTQQAILRAAMTEFADKGLGGARIDAIAERAGINKRLIYYYFDGKDRLFLAALEQTYADIRSAEQALHLESADPIDAVRLLVAFTWNHYVAHPEFLNLLNSE
ncbi:MAG TPA: TetR family transcriptional regulator, partial [Caldimonas sp.]